ncbi:MAG: dTDP-glucose 4,6-dehydratase [Verrucomicrobiota bacterium]
MKILLTGGCGFIGSNLVRLLLSKGHEIANLDKLTYAANSDWLQDLADNPNYSFQQADLSDSSFPLSEFMLKHSPHAVIHLAAESHVDRSIDSPSDFVQTNVLGTYHLLQSALDYWKTLPEEELDEALSKNMTDSQKNRYEFPIRDVPSQSSFRVVHVSTDEVFGSLQNGDKSLSETARYAPSSPYAATKAAADHLAKAWYTTYGLPVIVTNSSNNYGPSQYPEKLIPRVILSCLTETPIPLYGNGKNMRDWLHVEDHCEALVSVMTSGRLGECYLVSGDNELSNIELVGMLCRVMDQIAPSPTKASYTKLIEFVPDRPGHDYRYSIDSTKIKEELGWLPRKLINVGLLETVEWYLQNREWLEAAAVSSNSLRSA